MALVGEVVGVCRKSGLESLVSKAGSVVEEYAVLGAELPFWCGSGTVASG